MKAKKFDAVKMMRDIRSRLSAIYASDPMRQERDLEHIRKKYAGRDISSGRTTAKVISSLTD